MSTGAVRTDWIHLPADVEAESLWSLLHDGILRSIRSDRLDRTLTMEVEVEHVCRHHGLGNAAFSLELQGVESARATTWVVWPGALPELEGKSRSEQTRLVEEYQSKWREESIGWADFEARVAGNSCVVLQADAARGDGRICLRLGGQLRNDREDQSFECTIRGSDLVIRHGGSAEIDWERLVMLGEDYWDDWSGRKP